MKLAPNFFACFLTLMLATGCSDPQQSNIATPVESTAAPATPIQNELENITVKLDSPAFGSVDGINDDISPKAGSIVTIKGDKITIAGNYVDAVKGEAAAGVVAIIAGKPYVAIYGGERPDIAKALNNPKYLKSQFYVEVPITKVGAGLHDLKMRVISADKSGYYESDLIAKLNIK